MTLRTVKVAWLLILILIALVVFNIFFWTHLQVEQGQGQAHKPYNLIIISIDALRPDHMSLYGYDKKTTPNIDAWAKDGATIFTNAYTAVPITYASFATLMTGVPPWQIDIFNNGRIFPGDDGQMHYTRDVGNAQVPSSTLTLADTLHANQYDTAAYVTNDALNAQISNLQKGFDTYVVKPAVKNNQNPYQGILSSATTDLHAHADNSSGKPFFLWVHFLGPHAPYEPPKNIACSLTPSICATLQNSNEQELEKQRTSLQGCQLSSLPQSTVILYQGLYDGDIAATDQYVGELLKTIHDTGLDKDSIVVIYGDHGEGFDHNYYFTHSEVLYDSQIHIPLIIKYPTAKGASQRVTRVIQNPQIMPTLLKLLGAKTPETFSLPDFAHLVDSSIPSSADKTEHSLFFMNSTDSSFAVRQGNYKYIYTLSQKTTDCFAQHGQEQLFDVVQDPTETKNLTETKPDIAAAMKVELLTTMKAYSPNLSDIPLTTSDQSEQRVSRPPGQDVLKNLKNLGY